MRPVSILVKFIPVFLLFFLVGLQAQNLVPNPDFEGSSNCPVGLNNVGTSVGSGDPLNWYSPTDGTPDYFNSCVASPSSAGVPANLYGFQFANSGDSYGGFLAFGPNNSREYFAVALNSPLNQGETYCVNFSVSLADFTYLAVENIGAYFTSDINEAAGILNGGLALNSFAPQITNTGGVIEDGSFWTTISGNYTPTTSGVQYLIIGNFDQNDDTFVVDLSSPGVSGFVDLGYYYLDDVSVESLENVDITVNNSGGGNQPFACVGETVTLNVNAGSATDFVWSTIDDPFTPISTTNQLQFVASETESYIVSVAGELCPRADTITIEVAPIPVANFIFRANCLGYNTILADISQNVFPGALYEWDFDNDGVADANTLGGAGYVFPSTGVFPVTLTVTNANNCSSTITQNIEILAECPSPCDDPISIKNLVPNPFFQFFTGCPDTLSIQGSPSQILLAEPWTQPTAGSSDIFNSCGEPEVGVPFNQFGVQNGIGVSYAGFYAYRNNDYREYVSTPLIESLTPGQRYCVSFDVSLADSSGRAIDNIGVHLSDGSLGFVNTQAPLFANLPQVSNPSGTVIANKLGWTKIQSTFIPTSPDIDWLTIGNFYDNASTTVEDLDGEFLFDNSAYYYLDNVVVTPIPSMEIANVATSFSVDSVSTCVGSSINLSVADDFCSYAWYNLESGDTISFNNQLNLISIDEKVEEYVVVGEFVDCAFSYDTVAVHFVAPPEASFSALGDCIGAASIFTGNTDNQLAGTTYTWIFGDGDTLFNASPTVIHSFGQADTYEVQFLIENSLGCNSSSTTSIAISENCDPCNDENNLVINPSFEEQSSCPNDLGQIDLSSFWFSPNSGNPSSLFGNCADGTAAGIPDNFYGQQSPSLGNNYSGLVAYSNSTGNITVGEHQFVSGQLGIPMEEGKTYCVKMSVNLADESDYAIDKLGIFFSGYNPNDSIPSILANETPQVLNNSGVAVLNPNSWLELSTTIVADDDFQFLTIGNFENNAADLNNTFIGDDINGIAYYFIDNISVVPMEMEAPEDVSVCAGEEVVLTGSTNTCDFYWVKSSDPNTVLSTSTSLIINPTQTTTYSFIGDNGVCSIAETVTVFVNPQPDLSLTNDTTVCLGSTIVLSASGAQSFLWSSTDAFTDTLGQSGFIALNPTSATDYYIQATAANGCVIEDVVHIDIAALPNVNAGPDTLYVCAGDSVRLNGSGGDVFTWLPSGYVSDFSISDPYVQPTDTTTLYLIVGSSLTGCTAQDSIVVIPKEEYVSQPSELTLCAGQSGLLLPDLPSDAVSYSWSPSSGLSSDIVRTPITSTTSNTQYVVLYTDELGCQGAAVVVVDIVPTPNAGPDVSICFGGSVQLNASSGGTSYLWSPAEGLDDPTAQNPVASPEVTTDYTVEIVYPENDGDCSNTDSVIVSVFPDGVANAGPDQSICEGDIVVLNGIGGDQYSWTPDTGLSDATIANPEASPTVTTTYVMTVVNSSSGCISTDELTIFVTPNDAPIITYLPEFNCADPFEPFEICFTADYSGCEVLTTSVETQLGSSIAIVNETCFTYTSAFAAARQDTITVTVCTGSSNECDEFTTVMVDCDSPPSWPINSYTIITCEGLPVEFNLPEPTDPDVGDVLNITFQPSSLGSISVVSGTDLLFTPTSSGSQTIDVTVCDTFFPENECDILSLNLEVAPNQIISVEDFNGSTEFNTTSSVVCLDVTDDDLDSVTSGLSNPPNQGTVSFISPTCFEYTPNDGYLGTDLFEIQVCDACGACELVTVTMETIVPLGNEAPIVPDQAHTILVNTNLSVCLDVTEPNGDDFFTAVQSFPTNGSVIVSNDSCLVYTPNQDYIGLDIITFTVCDPFGACDLVTVNIEILPIPNDPPVVLDGSYITPFNTGIYVCMDVTDPDDNQGGITVSTAPNSGLVNIVNDTCFVYTPISNYIGNDFVLIEVCDDQGECDLANVNITVLPPPNQPPFSSDLLVSTLENTPVTTCLDITEPENESYTINLINGPDNGTLDVINVDCITYTPNTDYDGLDAAELSICDENGNCTTVTVSYIVSPNQNLAPFSPDTTVTTNIGELIEVCLEITEPNGDDYNISVVEGPFNGGVSVNTDDCFTYVPFPNFENDTDSLYVLVCDSFGACTTTTVYINVVGEVNLPPVANDVSVTMPENTSEEICITFSDPNGDPLTINIFSQGSNGTAILSPNIQCILYTPSTDFNGTDIVQVQICDPDGACTIATVNITVLDVFVNSPPIVDTPDPVTMTSGDTETLCLDATEPDGQGLDFTIVGISSGGGNASIDDDGCISFASDPDFVGQSTVTVQVCDDYSPELCVETIVVFNVEEANLAPIIEGQTVTTDQNTPVEICTGTTDPNGDPITISLASAIENGAVTINGDCITFIPNGDFVGTQDFTIAACDDQGACSNAIFTVIVNDTFIAQNDTIYTETNVETLIDIEFNDLIPAGAEISTVIVNVPDNGSAVVNSDGTITYVSDPEFTGTDSLEYSVCDPSLGCETAIVYINVSNSLTAIDDYSSTNSGVAITIDVLNNDIFPGDDPSAVTVSILNGVDNGGLTSLGDGEYIYISTDDFVGVDTFIYIISYPNSGTDTAEVYITVSLLPQAPIAVDDILGLTTGESIDIFVLNNDSDPNGEDLTLTDIIDEPENGTVSLNGDGSILYVPNVGFVGTDTIGYIICNNSGLCDSAIVVLQVEGESTCEISAYEVITPNNDGKNDRFVIEGLDCQENISNSIKIFNRWGNIVFEGDNYGSSTPLWEGLFKDSGNEVPDGTYFYIFDVNGKDPIQGYIEVHR